MAAPSHVWCVVTCSLCLVQVNFHVHTCHVGNYIFCLSRARIVSDYQSYIAHHIALQEHNSITHPGVITTCRYEEQPLVIFLEPSRPINPIHHPSLRNYHPHLCSPSPVSIFTSSLLVLGLVLCMDQSLAHNLG